LCVCAGCTGGGSSAAHLRVDSALFEHKEGEIRCVVYIGWVSYPCVCRAAERQGKGQGEGAGDEGAGERV